MSPPHQFSIRTATLAQDTAFIISVFDAALPYLASIGSVAQWGVVPFSQRLGWSEETAQQVRDACCDGHLTGDATGALRVLIAEVEGDVEGEREREGVRQGVGQEDVYARVLDDGRGVVAVGFAFVRENWFPAYLPAATVRCAEQFRSEESVYVEVMVSDARTKDLFQGAGAALLHGVREYGRSRGKKVVYLDAWGGNGGKLVRYYEQQGLQVVAEFSLPRPHKEPWVGSLMQLTI